MVFAIALVVWVFGWTGGKSLVTESYSGAKEKVSEQKEQHAAKRAEKKAARKAARHHRHRHGRVSASISPLDDGIGLVLESAADGQATLRLDPTGLAVVDDQEPPFIHGGALATCVDTAAWYAARALPGSWVVSSLQLDCLRLARPSRTSCAPHVARRDARSRSRTSRSSPLPIPIVSSPSGE